MITVNQRNVEWREGMTAEDVLLSMNYDKYMIAVWINEEPIAVSDLESTQVADKSVIHVIHMFAGG
ncbi:MAG: sulfur carrier protein ThiS [Synergistaceae bacterium]|nr:sulfur carrier protein ThiS [Synergistaceae bacterium]